MAQETKTLSEALDARLIEGALPGEIEGLITEQRAAAARFVAEAAATRPPGTPVIRLEALEGERRLRLAVINDDMPFLVDSIAATIAAHDVPIDRVIHPVVPVTRGADGALQSIGGGQLESMVYVEMRRADAKVRNAIVAELERNLAHVRSAVADWPALQAAMRADVSRLIGAGVTEGAALLQWFNERGMTLLGHLNWYEDGGHENELGIARHQFDVPLLADQSKALALDFFRRGGDAPLLLKSNCIATVHRRVPLDLVLVPIRDGEQVTGLSLHAGLWTSGALHASPREVPVLRERLARMEAKFGFDPKGHTGKALTHALTALPHDLTTAFQAEELEQLALTAMSLADRPRPKLALIRSSLGRHIFAFVWLPRDDVTTARRLAIGDMLAQAADATVLNWSIALEEGGVALIRYTLDVRGSSKTPDIAALDDELERMLRGWEPAIETALSGEMADTRAARLAIRYAGAFPNGYRLHSTPEEAARDVLRLSALEGPQSRSVRITPVEGSAGELRIKLYRLGGALPLSDAVPVFENFGFRVIEEVPTALLGEDRAVVHDFLVSAVGGIVGDIPTVEGAVAAVLEGRAENDAFNRLIVEAGMAPRSVTLFRASP